jgi:Trk K+ transport system NAD-binding subunit
MAVGEIEQLSRIRDLTLGTRKEGPLIMLGYGDVGKQVARALCNAGIRPIIVDRQEFQSLNFVHMTGEATSEALLVEAGIKDAVGIMVLLNNDSEVIYCTLLSKNLNPNAFVVARANRVESVKKIYRAGADYVASVPIVASHMLAKIIEHEKEELGLLYENIDLEIIAVGRRSGLVGRSLGEIDLPGSFGLGVVAIERAGQILAAVDQNTVIEEGDVLAMIGSEASMRSFSLEFGRRSGLDQLLGLRDKI